MGESHAEQVHYALKALEARHGLEGASWRAIATSFGALVDKPGSVYAAFACFTLLLRHGHDEADGLLAPERHGEVLAPLIEHGNVRMWGELSAALRREPKDGHAAVFAAAIEREKAAAKRRREAHVPIARILPALEWSLPSLVPLPSHVSLRATLEAEEDFRRVSAHTDGRDIFLPRRTAVFESRAHNELVYLRVLVHEALHIAEGSFAGRACRTAAPRVVARLTGRDFFTRNDDPPSLKSISAMFGHHSELFFGLLNCVEDVRIERGIPVRLPGFGAVVHYVDQAIRALATPDAFESPAMRILRGIQAELAGRSSTAVPATHAQRFAVVRASIRAFAALPAPTVAESISLATDLCLWFLDHVSSEAREGVLKELQFRLPVSSQRYELHADLAPVGWRSPQQLRPRMSLERFSRLAEDGVIVPEYDFWQGRLREQGASVVEEPWDPFRAGVQGRAVRCELLEPDPLTLPRPVYRASGTRLDRGRFVRLLAARRAGAATEGRVFHGQLATRGDAPTVVVVDLSVSMVHYRPDGVRPLERAVGVVESVAASLGADPLLEVFGAIDGGPDRVRLLRLKERHEPLLRSTLETLHGYSLGGFRMGALIRVLAQRAKERTRVYLVTDSGCHYVARGLRKVFNFDLRLCSDCPRTGSVCELERAFPDEVWIGDKASLFEPLEYEVEDVRHAIATTSHLLDVHVMMLTEHWGDDLCDHTFGQAGWSRV